MTHQHRRLQHSGFTLIEILVVSVILALILAFAGLNLLPDDSEQPREEARRLALLLQAAQEEAVLTGNIILVALEKGGYSFYQVDETGAVQPMNDELFRQREFADGVQITDSEYDGVKLDKDPRLVIYPTGEIAPFTITLSLNEARWHVKGTDSGEIRPTNTLDSKS